MKKEASLSIVEDVAAKKFLFVRNLRGINEGCINFPGGKKEPNEDMRQCVIRETKEETGLDIKNPQPVGYIEFPNKEFYVHVFYTNEFSGNLQAKDGEVEAFWLDKDNIPFEQMRAADRDFLPEILSGKFVRRRYFYDDNFQVAKSEDIVDEPQNEPACNASAASLKTHSAKNKNNACFMRNSGLDR
ncbi:MAG: 8-oxo-dGTP diphosphatase [Alphaproteobacteria bacterium]|nr:8-oxo-dGTP diphosphatase [Alphaproteobacteria bacterium]